MRTPVISSAAYEPSQVPQDVGNADSLRRFLSEELARIAATMRLLAAGHLDKSYVAPSKPRAGDIRYADGTTWNPGAGEGIYFYNTAGSWVQLG